MRSKADETLVIVETSSVVMSLWCCLDSVVSITGILLVLIQVLRDKKYIATCLVKLKRIAISAKQKLKPKKC